jgi:hypothetical protein
MVLCECILSDTTLEHLKTIQKMLQKDSTLSGRSDTIELLVKYIVSDVDKISVNNLIVIDDYFSEHPSFLHTFFNDFMLSATFNSNSYLADVNWS